MIYPRLLRQIESLLSKRQKGQAWILLGVLVMRAGIELLGVASIGPFMAIVANPSLVHQSKLLNWVYEITGFGSDAKFLTFIGILVIIVLAFGNGFSAFATWVMQRFVWGANHQISTRLLQGYLAQPYSFFVQRNSASLHKAILNEVQSVVSGSILALLNVIAHALIVVALAGMIIVMDPVLALCIVVVIGTGYGLVYLAVRRKQLSLGRQRVDANMLRFKVTGEAFGGIKDVKVLQREGDFIDQFRSPSIRFSMAMASNATISIVPKYLLETIAFGGILLIVLYHLQVGHGVAEILPVISVYAFAGYRLMPALQIVFAGFASIRFNQAALDDLCGDLVLFGRGSISAPREAGSLPFRKVLQVEDVFFRYSGSHEPALRGVTLSIRRNQIVGLVGASGSGKTTLVDLLLGLYIPEEGNIFVDSIPLNDANIPLWQRQVGYVPQHIFLSDDSLSRNIAFGVPPGEVDLMRVEQAARIAHLHDFILSLSDGYDTLVGERGVRLSGGQRQRIGIARALYHDPSVLVMDEATSALDGATEDAVMEAIQALAGTKTIILIAHRLTTVQECDTIYLMDHGRVIDQGKFGELILSSPEFRAMAKVELEEK